MSSRYYEDKEAEIVPGKISDELRAALNLAENDVPLWIYRMRALGYPPGWLNKAIVDTSDIFDTDVPKDGESAKRKSAPVDNIQYDHSKLIEYPGFNTPLPPTANDYHYYHNMPPMLPHQQLDYAKKTMSAFKPAPLPPKRFRTSTSPTPSSKNNTSTDIKGPISPSHDDSTASNDCETPASPDPETDDDSGPTKNESLNNNLDKTSNSLASIKSEKPDEMPASKAANTSTGSIKLVSKGSPMPQPVKRLPLERFSEGVVGELLYFENIPDSTGRFESIRGLLNTMRRSKSETDTSLAESDKNGSKNDNQ